MYLKTLVGLYAGQILDFSPEAARAMLADGRAVRVDQECETAPSLNEPFCDPVPPVQPHGSVASPQAGQPAGGDARQGKRGGILHSRKEGK